MTNGKRKKKEEDFIQKFTTTPDPFAKARGGGEVAQKPVSKTPTPEKKEQPEIQQPQVIRDQDTGRLSGVTLRGQTYLGRNVKPQDIQNIIARQAPQETPAGAIEMSDVAAQQARIQEVGGTLEDIGVFDKPPAVRQLESEASPLAKIPLIGSAIDPLSRAIASFLSGTKLKAFKKGDLLDLDALIEDPQTKREIMLAEIQQEQLEKTATANEAIGAAAESLGLNKLPFGIGEAVDKFTKTPSGDVNTLRNRIKELDSLASGMSDAAAQGELGSPLEVSRQISDMDIEISKVEAQLKFLVTLSSVLQSDPEEVNNIEIEILKARETLFEAKQRLAEGAAVAPSDSQLYLKLLDLKGKL